MSEYGKEYEEGRITRVLLLIVYISLAMGSIFYTKTLHTESADATEAHKGDFHYNAPDKTEETGRLEELIRAPRLGQDAYPTGCESVAAVMALKYQGYQVTVDEFIDDYLRIGTYYEENGQYYGNSPYNSFIGDPRSENGFGCFAPVIYDALSQITGPGQVKDLTGIPLKQIEEDYIAKGVPAIIWATIDMKPSYHGGGWTLLETGEYYTWPAEEHCLLWVGGNKDYYYFNAPMNQGEVTKYERRAVEQRYEEMGSQALAVLRIF